MVLRSASNRKAMWTYGAGGSAPTAARNAETLKTETLKWSPGETLAANVDGRLVRRTGRTRWQKPNYQIPTTNYFANTEVALCATGASLAVRNFPNARLRRFPNVGVGSEPRQTRGCLCT